MLLKVVCAECGLELGSFALSTKDDHTVRVHTCRCTPNVLNERAAEQAARQNPAGQRSLFGTERSEL